MIVASRNYCKFYFDSLLFGMIPNPSNQILALIERLSRLSEAEDWANDLNPAQMAALRYLAGANRFSRAPSHVAAFSGSTRGTVSQTLRALARKGLVTETRSQTDRRSISYTVTEAGLNVSQSGKAMTQAIAGLTPDQKQAVQEGLSDVLRTLLATRGGKPFGLCHQCRHHEKRGDGGYCRLLAVNLVQAEANQICHEQEPA
ncbi:MarR family transcriptional regulator [Hoeflea sp. YIM 152468]|uniref:MarR family winged helix-turn-helix transcriptional regulator n=1 Tax=Hoeflea sp. YIM 152468 TaxID=3031759 RepID=UPI0023DBFB20|nr:MarR family transcriptional regulator [Hoeflea sp. YIM 152468]MDF1606808.1 MarR family transcriptional regulator [Hoeflea sp. YIM 152468]